MNQQERDELREKHKPVKWNNGFVSCDVCNEIIEENYYPVLYPCDVIKMLDTTEYPPEGQNVECDVHEAFADALAKNHFALNYCPKCGEKL